MLIQPLEITLHLTPTARFDVIDVAEGIRKTYGDLHGRYGKTICCSFHTTAGYLDQGVCAKFNYSIQNLNQFIGTFQRLFPPNAGYYHDQMEMREELDESQKEREPINGDSHLTFMGAGLKNCVTYVNADKCPVYFIDLDGVYRGQPRKRRTTILAYNKEQKAYQGSFLLPMGSDYPINSFNLKDPRYGLFNHLNELLQRQGIEKGLIDIRLADAERHAGLTVNEYETLLMRNDLPDAMRDPLRYLIRRGKSLLQNPRSIPGKTKGYAIYDLIHLYNVLMNNLQMGRSVVDKALSFLSSPASRIFRLKRNIQLLVSNSAETGPERIVQGTYQSPILLQYQMADRDSRSLQITLWNLE